jgi:chromosome segregation ATPase
MWNWILLRIKRWVQPELERALDTLAQVRRQLDKASAENLQLKNRNEVLSRKVEHLETEVGDLQRALARDEQRTNNQVELIARLEQKQAEMLRTMAKAEAMVDALKDRVLKLEAERGNLPNFGTKGPKDN